MRSKLSLVDFWDELGTDWPFPLICSSLPGRKHMWSFSLTNSWWMIPLALKKIVNISLTFNLLFCSFWARGCCCVWCFVSGLYSFPHRLSHCPNTHVHSNALQKIFVNKYKCLWSTVETFGKNLTQIFIMCKFTVIIFCQLLSDLRSFEYLPKVLESAQERMFCLLTLPLKWKWVSSVKKTIASSGTAQSYFLDKILVINQICNNIQIFFSFH